MLSLDRDMVSMILITLDIGLPIVALFTVVVALAAAFHSQLEPAEASVTDRILRIVLADDAARSADAVLEGREPIEQGPDTTGGISRLPV